MTFCRCCLQVGLDGRVARRGDDPLVGGQQVIGVRMEVRDAPDHGRARDQVVASRQQSGEQLGVAGVALDQAVARIGVS